ncbi:hypothetical protein DUNSADRAFT_7741 [Dunaliella salina]|uniref:Encoded protein n=1 Tax=Dunaliella salina TaxID=3046 RepID=A0ABQ7GKR7_DUNSA|nr:hypothetical protein DUNSADRAFT_7741 [Dunaliella salina]|eukprot:KAF5835199.1 hypothetical protein DUNSADRAFT_7741 [Dunaliella salina]
MSSSAFSGSHLITCLDGSKVWVPSSSPDSAEQPSLYALCRAWQRPGLVSKPEQPQHLLPGPAPRSAPLPQGMPAPPKYQENFTVSNENYDAQVVLQCMKRHWVSVRQHCQAVSWMRTEQLQEQRMRAAMDRVFSPHQAYLPHANGAAQTSQMCQPLR